MSLPLVARAGNDRLCNRQESQYCRSSLDAVAGLHLDGGIAIEQNIHARAKLDDPNPLAAGYPISYFKIENDTARDQAGDLLEDYGTAFAFHGDDVLLVLLRRMRCHGVEELATLVAHVADHAGNRRAVHVHIEDAEKNADPVPRSSVHGRQRNIGHFTIAGRNDGPGDRGNLALGITEEPQKESRQQQHRDGVGPSGQPCDHARSQQAARSIEVAVTDHRNSIRIIILRKSVGWRDGGLAGPAVWRPGGDTRLSTSQFRARLYLVPARTAA